MLVIGRLSRGATGSVYTVVDGIVNAVVQLMDKRMQGLRIAVLRVTRQDIKRAVEHADNLR